LAQEETAEEAQGFQDFASKALRLHRKGAFENLLAQHLIMSVAADPLTKVRLVCEASWMLDPNKIGLDVKQVETIYTVVLSLLNTNPQSEFVSVAWGFSLTQENYERFIAPWRRETRPFFCSWCDGDDEDKMEHLEQVESKAEKFYLITHNFNLSPASLQMLKSEYLRWASPIVMEIFEKLSRLVQPDLYKEMLQILRSEVTHS